MTKLKGGTPTYRTPNSEKYYLDTCQKRLDDEGGTTSKWLDIVTAFKQVATRDIDLQKSQLLLANVKADGTAVVVKIGDERIQKEYEIGKQLAKVKGFVKYMCYFECDDNFYEYFSRDKGALCKRPGKGMSVLLMPHFSDGDVAHFAWTEKNVAVLRSCLQMAVLSYIEAFDLLRFVHGDFHPANVMMKKTGLSVMTFGDVEVTIHGYRTWIMDFENSTVGQNARSWTDMCFDLQKLFTTLTTFMPTLNKVGIQSIIREIFKQEDRGSIDRTALYTSIERGITFDM